LQWYSIEMTEGRKSVPSCTQRQMQSR